MTTTDWLVIILILANIAGWMLAHYYRVMCRFHKWNSERGWRHFTDAMDCLQAQRNLMSEMEERDSSGDEWKNG